MNNREYYCNKLKNQIEPIIYDESLELNRRKLLREELDGICEKGDPIRMIIAMMVTRIFKINNQPYYVKGSLVSSLIAYHLHIHDVDTFKHHCDYHICHGLNFENKYTLEFVVSQEYHSQSLIDIKSLLFDNKEDIKIYRNNIVSPTYLIFAINDIIYKQCSLFKDVNEQEHHCLTIEQMEEYRDGIVPLHISAFPTMTFLERMNKIYPIKEIDIYDIDNLLKLVNDNSLFLFDKEKTDFINETFNHYGYLTYDQLVDIICYFHSTRNKKDNYLKEDSINNRETAIELLSHYYPYNKTFALAARPSNLTDESDLNLSSIKYLWPKALGIIELTNKIRESYYLVNYVEESLKVILDTRFDENQIVNGIVNNDNEYESYRLKKLLHDYHSVFTNRYIGIFFFINGKLKTYKEKLVIDNTKEFIDVDKGHFELFNSYNMPREYEYSMFPRGRILYNVKDNEFYVYADKSILKDKSKINELKKEFNLPNYNIVFKGDEHYKMNSMK